MLTKITRFGTQSVIEAAVFPDITFHLATHSGFEYHTNPKNVNLQSTYMVNIG